MRATTCAPVYMPDKDAESKYIGCRGDKRKRCLFCAVAVETATMCLSSLC